MADLGFLGRGGAIPVIFLGKKCHELVLIFTANLRITWILYGSVRGPDLSSSSKICVQPVANSALSSRI